MILAIDTTSKLSGVALLSSRGKVLGESLWESRQNQSKELLPKIKELLGANRINQKNLKKIAVITGPGSFTGIRIGIAVANALGLALDIPVVGVDTLRAMAHQLIQKPEARSQSVIAILEANREQVYLAKYEVGCQSDKIVIEPNVLQNKNLAVYIKENDKIICQGSDDFEAYLKSNFLKNKINFIKKPKDNHRARAVGKISQRSGTKLTLAKPFYLKQANITQRKK